MPSLRQVTECRAHANAVRIVTWYLPHTGRVGVIEVRCLRVTGCKHSVNESVLVGEPIFLFESVADYRAIRSVEIVVNIGIGFELAEERQAVLELPLVVA